MIKGRWRKGSDGNAVKIHESERQPDFFLWVLCLLLGLHVRRELLGQDGNWRRGRGIGLERGSLALLVAFPHYLTP